MAGSTEKGQGQGHRSPCIVHRTDDGEGWEKLSMLTWEREEPW